MERDGGDRAGVIHNLLDPTRTDRHDRDRIIREADGQFAPIAVERQLRDGNWERRDCDLFAVGGGPEFHRLADCGREHSAVLGYGEGRRRGGEWAERLDFLGCHAGGDLLHANEFVGGRRGDRILGGDQLRERRRDRRPVRVDGDRCD